MASMRQHLLLWLVTKLFRIQPKGLTAWHAVTEGVLVIANHEHHWDWLILAPFLPAGAWFALHPDEMPPLWFQRWCHWLHFLPLDPIDPQGLFSVIKQLQSGGVVALFPSGDGLGHGGVGKLDDGLARLPALANVPVVAIWIDKRVWWRIGWRFLRVDCALQISKTLATVPLEGEQHRDLALLAMRDLLETTALTRLATAKSLWDALCQIAAQQGRSTQILEEAGGGVKLTFGALLVRARVVGRVVARMSQPGERVGVMLPTTAGGIVVFFALQAVGRVPAMINFTAGGQAVCSSCQTARIRSVLTSRRFVAKGGLESLVESMQKQVKVIFLEDLQPRFKTPLNLLIAWFGSFFSAGVVVNPDAEGVILFTSGTEGVPKGVALSHAGLLANVRQVQVRVGLGRGRGDELMLDLLPMFHAFGLTVAALAPLFSGVRLALYPSPLDYRAIVALAGPLQPTLMVGTDTFLSGYGRVAQTNDFASLRLVFAGGEPLREQTRLLWLEKFGVPIYEGYGTTESGPALTVNVPFVHRPGTVGRFLPAVEYRLEPVAGVALGGRLCVRGPNIMLGYIAPGGQGRVSPVALQGELGWYDTGDVAIVDAEGYVKIVGRLKRFAKIGGEMVSLAVVELLADAVWPECRHAAITLPDTRKGERIVLVTEQHQPERRAFMDVMRQRGVGMLYLPTHFVSVATIPLLGPGKVDFQGVRVMAAERLLVHLPAEN